MRFFCFLVFCNLILSAPANSQPGEIPMAQPGKCYAKCYVPDKFEVVSEQVMVHPAGTETVVTPAKFESVTAYVPVKEAATRYVVEPAVMETVTETIRVLSPGKAFPADQYDTVRETIVLRPESRQFTVSEAVFETTNVPVELEPAYLQLEVRPVQYETVPEYVEIKPAITRWVRKIMGQDCLGANPEDCFVWCLVEEPAQIQTLFKKISRGCDGAGSEGEDCVVTTPVAAKTMDMPLQKLKTPASYTEKTVPAETRTLLRLVRKSTAPALQGAEPGEPVTLTRQVVRRPARIREERVPAEFKPVPRKVLKAPASLASEPVPAEYTAVAKRRLLRKGGFSEWREVVCSEKISGFDLRKIQEALQALGYYKGAFEATMGVRTKAAIAEFQKERELPADGNVDFETLKALGIK